MVCKKRYFFALVFLIAGVCSALVFILNTEKFRVPFYSPESTSITIEHGDATVVMDFVPMGSDLGNPDYTSGLGSVSYMYRNSKMYDTLMQMGRWFGYRFGYEDGFVVDLCEALGTEPAVILGFSIVHGFLLRERAEGSAGGPSVIRGESRRSPQHRLPLTRRPSKWASRP